ADEPDERAEQRRDHRRREADDDRDAGADEQLREDVRADLGGAEPVLGARLGEHVGGRGVRVVGRERGAEDRDEDEHAEHDQRHPAALGSPQRTQADCTRGSRKKYRQSAIRFATITAIEKTRNAPWSIGKSFELIAWNSSSPSPGQEKIVSIV